MPEQFYTPFNGAGGQTRATDMDRLNLQAQGMQNARDAAMMELQQRMQMQQADIADRKEGRAMDYGDRDKNRAFDSSMFDKDAALKREFDTSQTNRAFGLMDRQMAPRMEEVGLERAKFNEGAGLRGLENQTQETLLKDILAKMANGGGAAVPGQQEMSPIDMLRALKGADIPGEQMRHDTARMELADAMKKRANAEAESQAIAMESQGQAGQANVLRRKSGLATNYKEPEALMNNWSVSEPVQGLMSKLTDAGNSTDGTTASAGAIPDIEGIIQRLVDLGADPMEARSAVMAKLNKNLPTSGYLSNPISSIIDTFLPGTPMGDRTSRTQVRRGLGLSGYGE